MNNKLLKKFFGKMLETFPNSNDFRLFLLKYLNYEKLMYEEQNHFEIVDHVLVKVTGSATSVVLPNEIQKIKNDLGISFSTLIPFSSERKIYTEQAWKEIEKFIS